MLRISRLIRENGIYLSTSLLLRRPADRLRCWLLARKLGVSQLWIGRGALIRGLSCMKIGEDFVAGPDLWLEAVSRFNDQTFTPRLTIGSHVRASRWVHIAVTNRVEIGDHVLIGSKVLITDHDHGSYSGPGTPPDVPPALRPLTRDRETVIGSNVWLGDSVIVTAGCRIGEGCVIGANSVVIGTIPPFTVAVGSPARVVKEFDFDKGQWIACAGESIANRQARGTAAQNARFPRSDAACSEGGDSHAEEEE